MLDVAARPLPLPGARLGRRVLRRPRRLAGAAAVIDAMAGCLRDVERQPGRRLRDLARRRTSVMERARAAAADFTGGEPEGIAFGANMTTLNFLLAHAVARTMRAGRRDRRDRARPRRERRRPGCVVAADHDLVVRTAPIRAERRDARPRRARGADRRAHARGRLHARVERGRLDHRRRRGSPRPPTRVGALAWADAVHLAPHRRLRARELGLDVAALLALQVLRAAPRGSPRSGPTSPRRCPPTACGRPRRTRPGTASRRARSRTRRSPGRSPRSSTCARSATATSTPAFAADRGARDELTRPLPRAALPGRGRAVRDPDAARGARRRSASTSTGAPPRAGGRAARRARHLRLGRRLLRPRADARPGPRRQRRRGPRRLPPLHDRGRGRPPARSADGPGAASRRATGRARVDGLALFLSISQGKRHTAGRVRSGAGRSRRKPARRGKKRRGPGRGGRAACFTGRSDAERPLRRRRPALGARPAGRAAPPSGWNAHRAVPLRAV